jgi:hypothetical protein
MNLEEMETPARGAGKEREIDYRVSNKSGALPILAMTTLKLVRLHDYPRQL